MQFKARYIHRRQLSPEYWRTIAADNLTEAQKLAERMTNKGYIMVGMTSTGEELT